MRGILTRNASTVASVDITAGAPRRRIGLINEARFKECCCPPICQWKSVFFWDDDASAWTKISKVWVPATFPKDFVDDTLDCIRYLYGHHYFCNIDPLPSAPDVYIGPPPETPAACCATQVCPAGLPTQMTVEGVILFNTSSGASGLRTVGPATVNRSASLPCTWTKFSVSAEELDPHDGVWKTTSITINVKIDSCPSRWVVSFTSFSATVNLWNFDISTPFNHYTIPGSTSVTGGSVGVT